MFPQCLTEVIAEVREVRTQVLNTLLPRIYQAIGELEEELSYHGRSEPGWEDLWEDSWNGLKAYLESPLRDVSKRALRGLIRIDQTVHSPNYLPGSVVTEVETYISNCADAAKSTPYFEEDLERLLNVYESGKTYVPSWERT